MDWKAFCCPENEKPLEHLVDGYSNTSIFRTIGFIGDSLSSGEFESRDDAGEPGYHDYYEYSWGQYIARRNGLTAYNFSQGGMNARWYLESFADEKGFWAQELACQAYVIALGVNDIVNQRCELGCAEDADPEDHRRNRDTFAGRYAAIVSRYRQIQPQAKFFFVTMPRSGDDRDPLREAHAKLLYDLAERFGNAYVIDLYRYGPVNDAAYQEQFYLYGHLNASGYVFTARMIDSYIDYIIRHHPDDFRRVPFIGKGLK